MLVRDDAFPEILKIVLVIFVVSGNVKQMFISSVSFLLVND